MPKDATKNVDRYKVRGGTLNEFEFHEGQEALAEEGAKRPKTKNKRGASAKKSGARKSAKK